MTHHIEFNYKTEDVDLEARGKHLLAIVPKGTAVKAATEDEAKSLIEKIEAEQEKVEAVASKEAEKRAAEIRKKRAAAFAKYPELEGLM